MSSRHACYTRLTLLPHMGGCKSSASSGKGGAPLPSGPHMHPAYNLSLNAIYPTPAPVPCALSDDPLTHQFRLHRPPTQWQQAPHRHRLRLGTIYMSILSARELGVCVTLTKSFATFGQTILAIKVLDRAFQTATPNLEPVQKTPALGPHCYEVGV